MKWFCFIRKVQRTESVWAAEVCRVSRSSSCRASHKTSPAGVWRPTMSRFTYELLLTVTDSSPTNNFSFLNFCSLCFRFPSAVCLSAICLHPLPHSSRFIIFFCLCCVTGSFCLRRRSGSWPWLCYQSPASRTPSHPSLQTSFSLPRILTALSLALFFVTGFSSDQPSTGSHPWTLVPDYVAVSKCLTA